MTTKTAEPASPAQKALAAAARATAAAEAELQPARDALRSAREAVAAAENEARQALTVKSADAQGARKRLEKARAAIKTAEDDLDWAVLRLNAFEAQLDQCYRDEQAARRAVTAEAYVRASEEWNDPENRERALLQQLTDVIRHLCPMISERKASWARLVQEFEHLPDDEKPVLPPGRGLMRYDFQRANLAAQVPHPELFDAINAGVGLA